MNDAAWDRITDALDTNFGLSDHGRFKRALADAPQHEESVQFVEFTRSGEEYRLERTTGPAIIDRKTVGARRAGAATHYEYIYDPDETAHRLTVFHRDDSGDWTEIDAGTLGL